MKVMFTFFLSLLILSRINAQWIPQNSGTTNSLTDVYFVDGGTGWAVGSFGIILKTVDGGTSWNPQTSGISSNLHSVYFPNTNTGWAVGDNRIFLRTTNGGENWSVVGSGVYGVSLNSICMVNDSIGWVAGSQGGIYKIIGNSWTHQTSGTTVDLRSVFFLNENIGWVVGGQIYDPGIILKTTNGGTDWTSTISDTIGYLASVFFIDENIGWAAGQYGTIIKTLDGGTDWFTQSISQAANLNSIWFTDANTGYAVGQAAGIYGTILKTTDGGTDWFIQTAVTINTINSIFFIDALTGWAVGYNGTILKTTNGGVTFIEEEKNGINPDEFILEQNYPNPFNPTTTIEYSIPMAGLVTIKIFDILGREVTTLVNEEKQRGNHLVKFNASNLSSGIYFYRLQAGNFMSEKKLILLK